MLEEQFSSNEDIVLPPVRSRESPVSPREPPVRPRESPVSPRESPVSPREPPVAHVDVDDIDVIFFSLIKFNYTYFINFYYLLLILYYILMLDDPWN